MDLMEQLEKTANEQFSPELQRVNETAEAFNAYPNAGAGRIAAGVGAIGAGTLAGARLGGLPGAAIGSGLGALGGIAAQVPITTYLNGKHPGRAEAYDDYVEALDAAYPGEKQASNLMSSLEKVAADSYPESGRIERGLLADTFAGAGIAGHYAKKNNSWGVNPEDSHSTANKKTGLVTGAGLGLLGGAAAGSVHGPVGAIGGGLVGAGLYGATGLGLGAITGHYNDKYDELLRNQKQEKTASEGVMNSLEKVAEREYSLGQELGDGIVSHVVPASVGLGVAGALSGAALGGRLGGAGAAAKGFLTGGVNGAWLGAGAGLVGGTASGMSTAIGKSFPGLERGENQSHTSADALAGAAGGATVGVANALGSPLARNPRGILAGAGTLGLLGGVGGSIAGSHRDHRDERARLEEEEEQMASEDLMYSLEKTAANVFGKAKNVANDFTGKNYAKAQANAKGTNAALKGSTNAADTAQAEQASRAARMAEEAAKKRMHTTRGAATGIAAGTAAGVTAGTVAAKREKEASELMDSLEKSAANAWGAIKNTVSKASGKEYNAANKAHKGIQKDLAAVTSPKAFEANARGVGFDNNGVAKTRNAMEKTDAELRGKLDTSAASLAAAKSARNEARGAIAPAAIGAAAAGGAAAGAVANEAKNRNEKTASEEFMNEMYKEAATQILDMHVPEVKAPTDPMDRITFRR